MDSQKIYLLTELTVLPEFLDDVKGERDGTEWARMRIFKEALKAIQAVRPNMTREVQDTARRASGCPVNRSIEGKP